MQQAHVTPPEPTPAEKRFGGSWKILIPFVFVPLTIVSAAVGVFLLFGKLADQKTSPEEYLRQLRFGSETKRWQAAFELSRYLARRDVGPEKTMFEQELLSTFKSSRSDESQLRKYLMIALAQVGSRASVPLLESLVEKPEDPETKIYAIWALGRLESKGSAHLITAQLQSDDAGIRKTAAFSLGFVGTRSDIPAITKLLEDPTQDVRWNAALGLAQLGSAAGEKPLLQMLDLNALRAATPNLREPERWEIVLSALNAVGKLKLKSALEPIHKLTQDTSDARLRAAAEKIAQFIQSN